jgi:hypothetical protein
VEKTVIRSCERAQTSLKQDGRGCAGSVHDTRPFCWGNSKKWIFLEKVVEIGCGWHLKRVNIRSRCQRRKTASVVEMFARSIVCIGDMWHAVGPTEMKIHGNGL